MSGRWILVLGALLALLLAVSVACAASEDSGDDSFEDAAFSQAASESADFDNSGRDTRTQSASLDDSMDDDMSESAGTDGSASTQLETGYPPVSAQNRLIVRIVDLTIEVDDVEGRMSEIVNIASARNGWVVSETRVSRHSGTISIRVPSAQLDETVRAISALGLSVLSLSSTSQDVTEEYFDIQSRIQNLNVTRDSLRNLLSREGELEDILEVQREITRVSEEIELLEGRKRYLEQTSATSLINVTLELVAGSMEADAGPDLQAVVGRPVVFRATFRPPEGIESYSYWWDFGDGAESPLLAGTAQTENEGERTTESFRHQYGSTEESPFFATLHLRGTGDAGVVETEDSVKVIVNRVPTIHVSTDETVTIRADEEVTVSGAFTRPEDVENLTYRWEFGDGLAPQTGAIEEGQDTIDVTHEYSIHRPEPYVATFTVSGETSFGAPITSSSNVDIYVLERSEWIIGFLDIGETARTATQTLSVIVQALIVVAIWVVLLSPIWGAIVAIIWFLRRRTSIAMPSRPRPRPEPDSGTAEAEDVPEPDVESDAPMRDVEKL